ncbi:MAG: hypothetical protein OWQ52_08410 [Metallosphaera prunae]|uniref:hypothetical protein n=1 Tax=Metallosphaera prunae TaxID=47304 RepID=UPI002273C3A5|nr:hypothetical protein [Metallosphaera prunae]MCY0862436.1 hypothetical protein [Metallosphaera prunae]
MIIVFPSFNYRLVYLGLLRMNVRDKKLQARITNLTKKGGKSYQDLMEMVGIKENIPGYSPIAPDGSFIVKFDETFLERLGNELRKGYPKEAIPILFITRIEIPSEKRRYSDQGSPYNNLLIGITLEKEHDLALVSLKSDKKEEDPSTAKYMWSMIYANRETLKRFDDVLSNTEFQLGLSLDYPKVTHKGIWTAYDTKRSSVEIRSKSVAYYLSSSFTESLNNEKILLDVNVAPLRVRIKTGGLSVEDIMVGSEIYFRGRGGGFRYPFLFPHIVPYTFLSQKTSITRLPSDIYVDAGALRIEVELEDNNVDQFLREICEVSRSSLNHLQFIQKLGLEWAVSDMISTKFGKDKVSYLDRKIEELVKFEFPNRSNSFDYTSFMFWKLRDVFSYFVDRSDTIMKAIESCDVKEIAKHAVKSLTKKLMDSDLKEEDKLLEEFKRAVAVSALVKSLHGLSHLLMKSLQDMMGLNSRSLGEIITVFSNVVWQRNYDGVVRYEKKMQRKIKGQLTIFLRRSLTSDYFEQVVGKNLNSVLSTLASVLVDEDGADRCTSYWNAERSRLEYIYSTLASSNDAVGLSYTSGKVIQALDGAMTRLLPQGDLYFHYPRQMYRYIYLNTESLRKTLDLQRGDNPDVKAVLNLARKYSQYVWPRRLHQCFDGCYNCVLIERGCTYVDVQQVYKVSRAGASYLLGKIRSSSS